jgi:hypothetical protein
VEAVSDRGGDRGDGNGNKLAAITEGGDKDADRYRWAAIRRRGAMTPTTTHVQRRNIAVRGTGDRAAGRREQHRGAWHGPQLAPLPERLPGRRVVGLALSPAAIARPGQREAGCLR